MSLHVEALAVRYGRLVALRDVEAVAAAGRVTAVVGPNAAGKSSLVKAMIGAVRPARGRVCLDGAAVHRTPPRRLARRLAYVPQRALVSARFTVREVVALGRYALPEDPARVAAALARLELADLADRPYAALSVGQQQRVTLARALAQREEAGVLVLDEPASAMDLRHARDALALLREEAASGATVVVVLHDLTAAARMADDAWVLDRGRLAAAGPAGEVLVPRVLEPVFEVPFATVTDPDGGPLLVAPPGRGDRRVE